MQPTSPSHVCQVSRRNLRGYQEEAWTDILTSKTLSQVTYLQNGNNSSFRDIKSFKNYGHSSLTRNGYVVSSGIMFIIWCASITRWPIRFRRFCHCRGHLSVCLWIGPVMCICLLSPPAVETRYIMKDYQELICWHQMCVWSRCPALARGSSPCHPLHMYWGEVADPPPHTLSPGEGSSAGRVGSLIAFFCFVFVLHHYISLNYLNTYQNLSVLLLELEMAKVTKYQMCIYCKIVRTRPCIYDH